jgi:hypothetical protein
MVPALYEDPLEKKRKNVKLKVLNDFTSSYELRPGFGMNITLPFWQAFVVQLIF